MISDHVFIGNSGHYYHYVQLKTETFNMYIDMVGYCVEVRVAKMTSLILVDKHYDYIVIDIALALGIYC
jgi:hypothetical protein